jgi:uncharacterized membrane protein YgdD (TMEM256/DUF423 family)
MRTKSERKIAAKISFFIGVLLMLLGVASLLGTIAGASRISVLISFLVVIIGAVFAVIAVTLNKRSVYFFIAAFFLQMGFFLFLSSLHILPFSLSESWPLYSIFAGFSLFIAGWHRYGKIKPWYVVPSVVLVIFGCILLMFSFNLVPFSFFEFVIHWWPLLFVLAGLVLVLASLGTKGKTEDNHK